MKLSRIQILLILVLIQFTFGCAHFFSSEYRPEVIKQNSQVGASICIVDGRKKGDSDESPKHQEKLLEEYKAIVEKLKRTYTQYDFSCSAVQKNTIVYRREQEEGITDFFVLSLGIIPLVLPSSYFVEVYDEKNEMIFRSINRGRSIATVFFTPFFFLHKSNEEIIFEELAKYLSSPSVGKL